MAALFAVRQHRSRSDLLCPHDTVPALHATVFIVLFGSVTANSQLLGFCTCSSDGALPANISDIPIAPTCCPYITAAMIPSAAQVSWGTVAAVVPRVTASSLETEQSTSEALSHCACRPYRRLSNLALMCMLTMEDHSVYQLGSLRLLC